MSALASPSMTRAATQPQVTVLFSTEKPTANTNPYLTQLYDALPAAVHPRFFDARCFVVALRRVAPALARILAAPSNCCRHLGQAGLCCIVVAQAAADRHAGGAHPAQSCTA